MSKTHEPKLIVGLDIGTAKVTAVVGEVLPDGEISVTGLGTHASRGMDKGGVNDLDSVARSVQRALEEAELMSGCQISSVYMSISGRHIGCQNENGMVSINGEEVTQDDVDSVIHTAQSIPMSDERRILHVIPQEYSIDCQEGIKSPIGMSGMRLEAKAHIITCANDMAKNLEKSVERCGLKAERLIFSALASGSSVLTQDEKDLGVCLVDIGGGTMDISVYTGGALRHTAVIPVAGNQVTNDIAKMLCTPLSNAEEIKVQYACAHSQMVSMEDTIEVPSVGGRPSRSMSRHNLVSVVEARYQELLELVREELRSSGFEEQITAGIVLTGGTANMEGAVEFAEHIFQMPVRLGVPLNVRGLSDYVDDPKYATAVGLLQFGKDDLVEQATSKRQKEGVGALLHRLQSWFKGEF